MELYMKHISIAFNDVKYTPIDRHLDVKNVCFELTDEHVMNFNNSFGSNALAKMFFETKEKDDTFQIQNVDLVKWEYSYWIKVNDANPTLEWDISKTVDGVIYKSGVSMEILDDYLCIHGCHLVSHSYVVSNGIDIVTTTLEYGRAMNPIVNLLLSCGIRDLYINV